MQTSSFIQNYTSNLLQQYISHLNFLVVQGVNERAKAQAEWNQMLQGWYDKMADIVPRMQELEPLIEAYQRFEVKNNYQHESLVELKRRIFRLLGSQLGSTLPPTFPPVVPESLVVQFCFYHEKDTRNGMRYQDNLYGLVRELEPSQRLQAYQLAWALSEQDVPFVFTTSESRYAIWVNLQSPDYAVLMDQGMAVLEKVLSLNVILCKLKAAIGHKRSIPEVVMQG